MKSNHENEKLIKESLKFTLCKDVSRKNLCGFHYHEKTKSLITSDGYTLTATKMFYNDSLANLTINEDGIGINERDFVNMDALLIKDFSKLKKCLTLIDASFYIKSKGRKGITIYFNQEKDMIMPSFTKSDSFCFAIKSSLLKCVAINCGLTVYYSGELSPVYFSFNKSDEMNDFTIIMPLKV